MCLLRCAGHVHADGSRWPHYLVATRPVDFRKGADGLALLAKETLGHDPMKGVAVVFR
ncbi:IS66 family insertion sequence element accessory protein TnpB, partial [Bradyrhizobium sp. 150]|nr:IS66 family insertion sequence element accessory protein TnpB [Bradyrhizobium sp. 150]